MAIYFIKQGEFVKIGHARDIKGRLADIQTSTPYAVSLLGVIKTSRPARLERTLHHKFRECHHRGEWYRLTPELSELIAMGTESPEPINVIGKGEPISSELLEWIRERQAEINAVRDIAPILPNHRPPIQLELYI